MASNYTTPINIQSLVTIKLTKDNYLLWTAQIVPYLCRQQLYDYVDGTILPPLAYIPNPPEVVSSDTTFTKILNPQYTAWYNQDQLVLSTLVSSLPKGILEQMLGITNHKEFWLALLKIFFSHS
ncbi:hypothetical protein I3843_05G147400 [Carya illinoinensis]|nr:hypothetical protein I3843_05G147400 [Carya illinoinensis]